MAKLLKEDGKASLQGNYGKDYGNGKIYESRSGSHVEQQIKEDHIGNNGNISIYTERIPCEDLCSPMIHTHPNSWNVNYTVPTGVSGRAKIYKEVKSSLANELGIKIKDLAVDNDHESVEIINKSDKTQGKVKKAWKRKANEKRSQRILDFHVEEDLGRGGYYEGDGYDGDSYDGDSYDGDSYDGDSY